LRKVETEKAQNRKLTFFVSFDLWGKFQEAKSTILLLVAVDHKTDNVKELLQNAFICRDLVKIGLSLSKQQQR